MQLPDATLGAIFSHLDASSLVALAQTCKYFVRKDSASKLQMTEHIAREQVLLRCGGNEDLAHRFRYAL